jgi:DNA-directed RNA polymerase subunit RPC12/RpoP
MSYDNDPEWCEIIIKNKDILECYYCGWKPTEDDIMGDEGILENIFDYTYYEARHIPPEIWVVCRNEECPHCEDSSKFLLKTTITIEKTNEMDVLGKIVELDNYKDYKKVKIIKTFEAVRTPCPKVGTIGYLKGEVINEKGKFYEIVIEKPFTDTDENVWLPTDDSGEMIIKFKKNEICEVENE